MKDFELVVHIGAGKTGTTSVQRSLRFNRENLEENGAFYLGLMLEDAPVKKYDWQERSDSWSQLVNLQEDVRNKQLTSVLLENITYLFERGFKKAIWSNESILGNEKVVTVALKTLSELGLKIKIIAYVRRPDKWAQSAYLQWGIKHKTYLGPIKSFKEWYDQHPLTNFSQFLKVWLKQGCFDLEIRNFDACEDVTHDFLIQCNIDPRNFSIVRENETPSMVSLALWSFYNSQFNEPVLPVELYEIFDSAGLIGKDVVECNFSALLPTEQDIQYVLDKTSEDRIFFNQIFRNTQQPEIDITDVKIKENNVTQEQIYAALMLIIKQQYRKVQSQQILIKNLERTVSSLSIRLDNLEKKIS